MNRKKKANVTRASQRPASAAKAQSDYTRIAGPLAEVSRDLVGGQSAPINFPVIEVSSYSELCSKVAELTPSANRLSFRGQVRNHGHILCSVARKLSGIAVPSLDLAELNSNRASWLQAASELAEQLLPTHSGDIPGAIPTQVRQILAEAFLQHYGCQTHFIDASWSIDIAVYFALLKYHERFPVVPTENPIRPANDWKLSVWAVNVA